MIPKKGPMVVLPAEDRAPQHIKYPPLTSDDGIRRFTALDYAYVKYLAWKQNGRRASLWPFRGVVYISFGDQLFETAEKAKAFLRDDCFNICAPKDADEIEMKEAA